MHINTVLLKSCARGLLGKKNFHNLTTTMRVATIQRCIRGWLCRRKYRRVVRGVTKMQGLVRRMIAKRKVKMLKVICSVNIIQTVILMVINCNYPINYKMVKTKFIIKL